MPAPLRLPDTGADSTDPVLDGSVQKLLDRYAVAPDEQLAGRLERRGKSG
jgi:hypothetical protein